MKPILYRHYLVVIALVLVASAVTTPLSAQMWYESSPPIPRTPVHNQIAPAAFASTELTAELANLGPAQVAEPSCYCGKNYRSAASAWGAFSMITCPKIKSAAGSVTISG